MRIGLFFGTFNPIHIGHLWIAQSAINMARMDKIWFVVSPSSPDKDYTKLLHEFDRFDLVQKAILDNPDFKATDVEFRLPKPSYTYHTIRKLKAEFPEHEFFILVGGDNFQNLDRWKNIEELRQSVRFIVYGRGEKATGGDELHTYIDAPVVQISSTYIRELIRAEKSVKYLVPDAVASHIDRMKFYTSG